MTNQAIKDRIRALLNLARDDAAAEGEINNALKFARRLMMRHNLSEDDLSRDPHEQAADMEYRDGRAYSEGKSLSAWECILAWAVAGLVGSVKWYHERGPREVRLNDGIRVLFGKDGKPREATPVVFYGPGDDVSDACNLFDEWREVIAAMARLRWGTALRKEGRDYAMGFTRALYQKVMEITKSERLISTNQQAVALLGEGCTAMMIHRKLDLQQAQQQKAEQWLRNERGIRLGRSGGARSGARNGNAYAAGQSDGKASKFTRVRTKRLGN